MPAGPLSPLEISALLIERDAESAKLIQVVLEPWGVTVVIVASIREAEIMIATVRPDIILCDIVAPHGDGLEFIRRLRTSRDIKLKNIPAIAITAAYEDVDARAARAAGFDVFIRKPIDPDQLPHTVALLIGQAEAGGDRGKDTGNS